MKVSFFRLVDVFCMVMMAAVVAAALVVAFKLNVFNKSTSFVRCIYIFYRFGIGKTSGKRFKSGHVHTLHSKCVVMNADQGGEFIGK